VLLSAENWRRELGERRNPEPKTGKEKEAE
jgi:hypothetical protein